jgi:hypothetical protein
MRSRVRYHHDIPSPYEVHLLQGKERRARLKALKLCINGATHPQPTKGVRCDHCIEVHKRSNSWS